MLKIESFGWARSTHRAAVENSRLCIRNYGRVIDPALPKTQAAYFQAGRADHPTAFVVTRMRNVVGLVRRSIDSVLKIESYGRARSTHRAAVEKSRLYIRNYGRVIDPALPKTQAAYFPAGKAGFPMPASHDVQS